MKNLANCDPVEFLIQTGKIRRAVSDWLSATKILEIRKRVAVIPDDATPEERLALRRQQMQQNLMDMLDSVLESNPEQTAVLLGLCCFIEPENLREYKMSQLLGSYAEIISDRNVLDFFISLANLGQTNILTSVKA